MADPVTIALATALVTGAAAKISEHAGETVVEGLKRLQRAVFKRFRGDAAAQEALDEARVDSDDPAAIEAVAEHLERAAAEDPEIGSLVRELRGQVSQRSEGSVSNRITGGVSGNARVFQGGNVQGEIRL
ncbi:hypothetical protein [Nocardiopsis lambiniae]|uniref:RHIM domain-containing protein n=1 Tax=Nocardiopsis lambiniae TaxID=3075539 RepID=A0ABU2M910_9ACTN|nr:hypothetical protein [Nocardiopsis sp. DSM 44743]MDT0329160.1 hypothetical protein [Nocardiopsis sp. DSM 44743]